MPQICDMGPTTLLENFFHLEKSDGFGQVRTRELE
jgi:hypothetical protein